MSLTIAPARIVEESSSPLLASHDSWERRPLGVVATILNGHAFPSKQFTPDRGTPLIRIRDISRATTSVRFDGDYDRRYLVEPGELLVGMDGHFNCALWRGPEALLNQRVCKITPDPEQLDLDFITHLLPGYLQAVHDLTSSTTVTHLSSRDVAELPIPVPPLDVQRGIALALDRVSISRASAAAHTRRARTAINRFRRSVLVAACTGRLTAAWREERSPPDWKTERAADLCAKVQSGTTPKMWHTEDGGVPFVKVYNIVDQKLDFDYRPQFIAPDLHRGTMARATATPGDVLMNIVGPPLGKVAVVTDQYSEWSINQALTLFRPSERVTTQWLYIFLCSGISVEGVLSQTRGSVGQVNISLSQCRDFQIPVPSLEEQIEIARRIDELLAVADGLEQRIETASKCVARSSQAVLAKAFRGELNANDGKMD